MITNADVTNADAAKQLRLLASFIESEEGSTTKLYAHVKLTTPKPKPGWAGVIEPDHSTVTSMTLNTRPDLEKEQ